MAMLELALLSVAVKLLEAVEFESFVVTIAFVRLAFVAELLDTFCSLQAVLEKAKIATKVIIGKIFFLILVSNLW